MNIWQSYAQERGCLTHSARLVNTLLKDRIAIMSVWPRFSAHPEYQCVRQTKPALSINRDANCMHLYVITGRRQRENGIGREQDGTVKQRTGNHLYWRRGVVVSASGVRQ